MNPIRFRNASRALYLYVWSLIALMMLLLGTVSIIRDGVAVAPLAMVMSIVALLWTLKTYHECVILDAQGILIRGLRGRRIDWSNVADLRIRRIANLRQAQVVVHGNSVTNLAVPCDRWPVRDRSFDEKYEVLHRYWRAYRSHS